MIRAFVLVLSIVSAASAFAGDVAELSVGIIGGSNVGFGTLTRTDWRLHDKRGADVRLTVFANRSLSAAIEVGKQRIESRTDGVAQSGHAEPEALMIDWSGDALGRATPYVGAGASYLRYRQSHATADGQLMQPDHAALMTEAGLRYVLTPKWRLNTGVRFGPARSTAEVTHGNGSVEHIDFHQLYLSAGLGYAF